MNTLKNAEKNINISLPAENLTPQQVRIIKALNTLLTHVCDTEKEKEFFTYTEEAYRLLTSLVKQSQFATKFNIHGIAYGQQAVEMAVESVIENLHNGKTVTYDN